MSAVTETRSQSYSEIPGLPTVVSRVVGKSTGQQSVNSSILTASHGPIGQATAPFAQVVRTVVGGSSRMSTVPMTSTIAVPPPTSISKVTSSVGPQATYASRKVAIQSGINQFTAVPITGTYANVDVLKKSPLAGMRLDTDVGGTGAYMPPRQYSQSRASLHSGLAPYARSNTAESRRGSVSTGTALGFRGSVMTNTGTSVLTSPPIKPGALQIGVVPEGLDDVRSPYDNEGYEHARSRGRHYRLMRRQPGACASCNACFCGACDRPNGWCATCNSDGRCDRGGRFLSVNCEDGAHPSYSGGDHHYHSKVVGHK